MRILVVYFSQTGHTRQIAKEIAERCDADLEEIRELQTRKGVWAYLRSGLQVLFRTLPAIQLPDKSPEHYDTVVIGTPVWIQRPAPPVLSYLRQYAPRCKKVAFFCTEGGSGERQVFDALRGVCGKKPLASLAVTEKQLPLNLHVERLTQFTDAVTA